VFGSERICHHVHDANAGESRERDRARRRNSNFNPPVNRDGAFLAFAPLTKPRAAGCEPSHEDGEDCGDRVSCVAEDKAKFLAPGDLIDQPGGARKEKAHE
jgi:hypothetical protein